MSGRTSLPSTFLKAWYPWLSVNSSGDYID